jgi:hypothetical protein
MFFKVFFKKVRKAKNSPSAHEAVHFELFLKSVLSRVQMKSWAGKALEVDS